jgi:dihydroflavonol-4-reductase
MDASDLPKRILVLGARGFLGEHVVQQLAAGDFDIVAVVRPGSKHAFDPARVAVLEGDLNDVGFLRKALDQAEAVIFAAGRTWQPGLPDAEYQRQNVVLTEKFFEALGHRPEVRVVFTSSLSAVAGSREPRVFAEDAGRAGVCERLLTPYDRAKIACEQIALVNARRGNQVVVLNPGLLLGPGANPQSNLAAPYTLLWLCQGKPAARAYVNGGVTLCDVRDVARAHVAALRRGRSGQRYILGGHNLDRREFYARVAQWTGVRPPRRLPGWLVRLTAGVTDAAAFLSRGRVSGPVQRSFARGLGLYYYGESRRAVEELGYTTTPLDVTVFDMLRYYRERGLLTEEWDFIETVTAETAPTFALLKQLARRSPYASFLLPRVQLLHEICQSNHALREALQRLLTASRFEGRFRWDRAACRADVETLTRFFERVFFSSDEFLREVL